MCRSGNMGREVECRTLTLNSLLQISRPNPSSERTDEQRAKEGSFLTQMLEFFSVNSAKKSS